MKSGDRIGKLKKVHFHMHLALSIKEILLKARYGLPVGSTGREGKQARASNAVWGWNIDEESQI